MKITATHNAEDFRAMLLKIETLWDAEPNTAEIDIGRVNHLFHS